jgi:hypothetical protein
MARPGAASLDHATLAYALQVLEERLRAVETYGAGGRSTCRDAELRGALATLRAIAKNEAVKPPS